jgi:hypothetical protein
MTTVSSLTAQGAGTYTPGDSIAPVRGLPQNPPFASLGMTPPRTGLPLIGLVAIVVVLLLFERRRLKLGGRR